MSLPPLVPLTLTTCRLWRRVPVETPCFGGTLLVRETVSYIVSWCVVSACRGRSILTVRATVCSQPPRIGPVCWWCWWWMSSLHLVCLLSYRCAHGKLSFLPHFAQWRTQFVSLSQLGVTSSAPQQQPPTPRESEAASDRAFGRQKFASSANRPLCLVGSLSWPCD